MNEKLLKEVLSWLKVLPTLQANFVSLGHHLPNLYVEQVEAMRARFEDERRIDFYSNQRTVESAYLQFVSEPWLKRTRSLIPIEYKSTYLDLLQAKIERGELDLLHVAEGKFNSFFDINLLLFQQWKWNDELGKGLTWERFLSNLRAAKRASFQTFLDKHESFAYLKSIIRPEKAEVLTLFRDLAEALNLKLKLFEDKRKPRVIVEAEVTETLSLYLEWSDFYIFKRDGVIDTRFVMRERTDPTIWSAAEAPRPLFYFSFDNLIPGGEFYTNSYANPQMSIIGLIACMEFMTVAAKGRESK